jgi:eukaryotic-like serine/threonine-protein kinase
MSRALRSVPKQDETLTEISEIVEATSSFTLVELEGPTHDDSEMTEPSFESELDSAPTCQRSPVLALVTAPAKKSSSPPPPPPVPGTRKATPLLPPPPRSMSSLPPPSRAITPLPPLPRGMSSLPPPPSMSSLPRPPFGMSSLPPPPFSMSSLPPPPSMSSVPSGGSFPPPPSTHFARLGLTPSALPPRSMSSLPPIAALPESPRSRASHPAPSTKPPISLPLPPTREHWTPAPRSAASLVAESAPAPVRRSSRPQSAVSTAPLATMTVEAVPGSLRPRRTPRRSFDFTFQYPALTPRARRLTRDAGLVFGFLLAFATLGSVAALVARAASRYEDAQPTSGVVVTVAGPGGTVVPLASVYVDGNLACETAPCTLGKLSHGMHFVQVMAQGFATTAPRAVAVEGSDFHSVHFDLTRELTRESAPPSAPQAAAPVPVESLGFDSAPEPTKTSERPARSETASAAGPGTLNINSVPISNVLVDGRPLGPTPQVGIRVAPGAHSILFVSSDYGRAERQVTVAPGSSRTVAVRLGN